MNTSRRKVTPVLGLCLLTTVVFVLVFAQRKVVLIPDASHDDALFVWLGHKLATGSWLGGYTDRTLIKGVGFPLFLAFNHLTGLPYTLGIGLLIAASAAYLAWVVGRLTRSMLSAAAVYIAVLLTPGLFQFLRVTREHFYAALTLAMVGAALHLFLGEPCKRARAAVALGLIGAIFWLTREEGIWILPALVLSVAIPTVRIARERDWRKLRHDVLQPAGMAVAVGASLLLAVATANLIRFGNFTTNEVKGGEFQAAMVALQKAAFHDGQPFVPVPHETRLQVYEVSPTFRQLRQYIDPPEGSWGHKATCNSLPKVCGDIAGGWFLWVLRDAASRVGVHANASTAARFYQDLANEVNAACGDGRLSCARFLPPLLPPMSVEQVPSVLRSTVRAFLRAAGAHPINIDPPASLLVSGPSDLENFVLNRPAVFGQTPEKVVRLGGRLDAAQPKVIVSQPNRLRGWTVEPVGGEARTPRRNRYNLEVACFLAPCTVAFVDGETPVSEIDLDSKRIPHGTLPTQTGSTLTIDLVDRTNLSSIRDQTAAAFLSAVPMTRWLYAALNLCGVLAFGLLCSVPALRRDGAVYVASAAVVAVAVAGRALVIALVDATSFPAVTNAYLLPASVLLSIFSSLSIIGLASALILRVRRC